MNRYVLMPDDCSFLYKSLPFNDLHKISVPHSKDSIFVDILDVVKDKEIAVVYYRIKLLYSDGSVLEGWISDTIFPLKITNYYDLFDGRFNALQSHHP